MARLIVFSTIYATKSGLNAIYGYMVGLTIVPTI
jgi:hypothetical protein